MPGTNVGVPSLVARYAGAALLVDAAGAVLAASEAAGPLAVATTALPPAAWWRELRGWLDEAATGGPPLHLSLIEDDRGATLIEWSATELPDGTVLLLGRDVTIERSLRDALAESRQRFRDFVELACAFAWETDASGRFVYISPDGALGHEPSSLIGQSADAFAAEPTVARPPFEARQWLYDAPVALRRLDGGIVEVLVSARPMLDATGGWVGARGVCRLAAAPDAPPPEGEP